MVKEIAVTYYFELINSKIYICLRFQTVLTTSKLRRIMHSVPSQFKVDKP